MKHIEKNEIRKRINGDITYYVIGEAVREQLLAIVDTLQSKVDMNYLPPKWNTHDKNALSSMDTWLRDGRDFNNNQLVKFFRMLRKFGLPQNITLLAKEMEWHIGKHLTQNESFEIMQERRDKDANDKQSIDEVKKAKDLAYNSMYSTLFE